MSFVEAFSGSSAAPTFATRAIIVVNGVEYTEWKSVHVRLSIGENPPYTFRFTNSEQEPLGASWSALRIRPGDKCAVILDGELAITGFVATRQVFYNATQHDVEIQGIGTSGITGRAAAVTQTGEFKKIDLQGLASSLCQSCGVNVSTKGNVSGFQFDRVSIQPGERIWDAIEKHARAVKAFLTSNAQGDLVLFGGSTGGGDEVIEGVNILEGREVISAIAPGSGYEGSGQTAGNDQTWGADPNQRHAEQSNSSDFGMSYAPHVVLSEIPAFAQQMVQQRAQMEDNVGQQESIYVTVVILGWQRPSGGLWEPGQQVVVTSPMLIMNGQSLTLKTVTFSQDNNSGTISTLELVNNAAMGGYEGGGS